jgi:hypothetical protein
MHHGNQLFTVGNHDNYGNQVICLRGKKTKVVAGFGYKESMDIS